MDKTADSIIDKNDFKIQLVDYYNTLLEMTKEGNNKWIWNNYFQVTSQWLKAHFQTEANKTRMLRLNLPIYIFHGKEDSNTPINGVYDIQERFKSIGKDNLNCQIFDKHDHDLNYSHWLQKQELPEGIEALFNTTLKITE